MGRQDLYPRAQLLLLLHLLFKPTSTINAEENESMGAKKCYNAKGHEEEGHLQLQWLSP